jgi:hypothetical protein
LLKQLGNKPDPVQSLSLSPPSRPLTAEDEEVVRSALLPNPAKAIDTLLLNLLPCDDQKDFPCVVHLHELNEDEVYIVRKTLAAGAALVGPAVRADR